MTLLVRL